MGWIFSIRPLPKFNQWWPVMTIETIFIESLIAIERKYTWKCCLQYNSIFCSGCNVSWTQSCISMLHWLMNQGQISLWVYELIIQISKFICRSDMKNYDPIMLQFCTCHISWADVTCAKLWHDWIIRIKIKAKRNFTRFQLWSHKFLVNRFLGSWLINPIHDWLTKEISLPFEN